MGLKRHFCVVWAVEKNMLALVLALGMMSLSLQVPLVPSPVIASRCSSCFVSGYALRFNLIAQPMFPSEELARDFAIQSLRCWHQGETVRDRDTRQISSLVAGRHKQNEILFPRSAQNCA